MNSIPIPNIFIEKLESSKTGTADKLRSLGGKDHGPTSYLEVPKTELAALIADGWLPNQSPFAVPLKLSAEQMAAFNGPGVGTELSKLIEEMIGVASFAGCQCNSRIVQMNKWGACGCVANMTTIVGWLYEAFKKLAPPGTPFNAELAKELVNQAIENSSPACCKASAERDGSKAN